MHSTQLLLALLSLPLLSALKLGGFDGLSGLAKIRRVLLDSCPLTPAPEIRSRFDTLLPIAGAAVLSLVAVCPALADEDDALKSLVFAKPVLDTLINTMSVLFLARIIMSWYPKTDIKKFPYNAITWPTEPLMAPARELLPPAFGVDISAIVWLGLLSFIREILTGQQGILTLMASS